MRSKLNLNVACTILIFLFIVVIRIPHLTSTPYEYDSWRQSDTEAIARNFVEHKFNIFYPQLNYQGPLPNYVQLEFQITTFLIAVLYKLFGYHYVLSRIVPLLFFIGSAYFLFLVAKKHYNIKTAWITLFIYGILPINILYSRAIMPESAALFFYVGAYYFFSNWIVKEKTSDFLLAICFTALAISQKVPTIFIGIPMIYMGILKFKKAILSNWKLWFFAISSLLPPFLYFYWLKRIAEYKFVSGIATKHILPNMLTAIIQKETLLFFYRELPNSFTWIGLCLFIIGLLSANWNKESPLIIWCLAIILEMATIVAVIKFNYYLIFFSPLIAIFASKAMAQLFKLKLGTTILFIVVVWFFLTSYIKTEPVLNKQNQVILKQAEAVERITNKDDLIVVGTDDPSLLNATHRIGWRIMNSIPNNKIAEIQYFVKNGAKYFVPLQGYIESDNGEVKEYLESHYKKINVPGGFSIYKFVIR